MYNYNGTRSASVFGPTGFRQMTDHMVRDIESRLDGFFVKETVGHWRAPSGTISAELQRMWREIQKNQCPRLVVEWLRYLRAREEWLRLQNSLTPQGNDFCQEILAILDNYPIEQWGAVWSCLISTAGGFGFRFGIREGGIR